MQPLSLMQSIQIDEFKKLILGGFLNLRGENLQVLTWMQQLKYMCDSSCLFVFRPFKNVT